MARVLKPDMEPGIEQMKAYIFSVAPYVACKKTFGFGPTVHVAAREAGSRYSRTELVQGTCYKDYGENQKEVFVVDPMDMAKDIINDCPGQGLWASTAPTPSEEDIVEAERKQREFYLAQINEADSEWAKSTDPKRIPFHARIAARELNIKREWAKDISGMVPCEGCRELISADAAKCGRCGAVLNWEKAQRLGLVSEEQMRFATKRGIATEEPVKKAKTA